MYDDNLCKKLRTLKIDQVEDLDLDAEEEI